VSGRVKSLCTAALGVWSSHAQLSIATHQHRARVTLITAARITPVVLWQGKDLFEVGFAIATKDFIS